MYIRKKKKMQTMVFLLLAQAVLVSGCSFSFCGFSPGGQREMVFACEPEPAEEPDMSAEEPESVSEGGESEENAVSADPDGKVDLNSAGLQELTTLNGIGETRAKAILEYRTRNGPFAQKEDIMLVPGIKEGIYTKIQDQIVVH